jgi:predicted nucleic acid-binding protein
MPDPNEEPKRCFIDTNIWLYALIDTGAPRREVAKRVVSRAGVVISAQVINETCVNLLKKTPFSEASVRQLVAAFYEKCAIADLDRDTLLQASRLRETYDLSFWDSVIVSSALCSGCEVLYTEDMQHGLEVNDQLKIVNPFAAPRANGVDA